MDFLLSQLLGLTLREGATYSLNLHIVFKMNAECWNLMSLRDRK